MRNEISLKALVLPLFSVPMLSQSSVRQAVGMLEVTTEWVWSATLEQSSD